MATSFSMDTIGFLQAINKLERRFEELVSPETMRKVCEDYDRDGTPTPWDHRLYALPPIVTPLNQAVALRHSPWCRFGVHILINYGRSPICLKKI